MILIPHLSPAYSTHSPVDAATPPCLIGVHVSCKSLNAPKQAVRLVNGIWLISIPLQVTTEDKEHLEDNAAEQGLVLRLAPAGRGRADEITVSMDPGAVHLTTHHLLFWYTLQHHYVVCLTGASRQDPRDSQCTSPSLAI